MTKNGTYYPISWLRIGNIQSASALPFLRKKKNQPIAGKNLPAKPHKSGPSKKEEKTAKVLKVKKNGKKKSW
jgi:hypothetical protein